MKNYYQILNVKPTATEDEIKRSYRVLAKRYHPDVNPNDALAAERFTDINEAHDVLSDPKKRAEFDAKLKESAAPKLRPEDVMARQRAAARQAARQAAMRNTLRDNMRQQPHTMTQQRAAAQQHFQATQQQYQAAQQHFQQQQFQAVQQQYQAMEKQAFAKGHERGLAEARAAAEREKASLNSEIRSLNSEIRSLKAENKKISDQLAETEQDRADLEQELFNRDRELTHEKQHTAEIEKQVDSIKKKYDEKLRIRQHTNSEYDALKAELDKAKERSKQLELDKSQAELKNKAQMKLHQDKRKEMQQTIEELTQKVHELTDEIVELRAENDQWQQYARSEEFLSDAEERLQEWEKKQKADKKLAKLTLYGTLGVLIWSTGSEIDAAYSKLVKRYNGKTDDGSVEKLKKIKDAYETLSDPIKRREYNVSIGITDERIEDERRMIVENENMRQEYRKQLESREFWAHFDELTFSAQTGDADAQNQIGEMYYYGDEIEQDFDQAVYWFKEAAKQKHAEGMFNLGVCFINGEGVEKNKTMGMGFIRQAAKLGSKGARQYMNKN